jgi:hypothetical protein
MENFINEEINSNTLPMRVETGTLRVRPTPMEELFLEVHEEWSPETTPVFEDQKKKTATDLNKMKALM